LWTYTHILSLSPPLSLPTHPILRARAHTHTHPLSLVHWLSLALNPRPFFEKVLNALMERDDSEAALKQLVIGTVPAGSECAFAKMTTFIDPYAAGWVLLKGHRVSAIDVMRITQVLPREL